MALTRARVIGGDDSLHDEVDATIRSILTRPRDAEKLRRDVHDMRRLIAQEKGESDPWDLKLASGGVIDIEFIAQYLALRHGQAHPLLLDVDPAVVIAQAQAAGLLPAAQAVPLREAHHLFATVTQTVRLSIEGPFDPKQVAAGVLRRIAAAANSPDFPRLERQLSETRREVRAIFEAILKR